MIGYWHDTVLCLTLCLSVSVMMLSVALWVSVGGCKTASCTIFFTSSNTDSVGCVVYPQMAKKLTGTKIRFWFEMVNNDADHTYSRQQSLAMLYVICSVTVTATAELLVWYVYVVVCLNL